MSVLDNFMTSMGNERSRQSDLRERRQSVQDREQQLRRLDQQLKMQQDQTHRANAIQTLDMIRANANNVEVWRDNPGAIVEMQRQASEISRRLGAGEIVFTDPRHGMLQQAIDRLSVGDMTLDQTKMFISNLGRQLGTDFITDYVKTMRNTKALAGTPLFAPAPVVLGQQMPNPQGQNDVQTTGPQQMPAISGPNSVATSTPAQQMPAVQGQADASMVTGQGLTSANAAGPATPLPGITPKPAVPGLNDLPPAGQAIVAQAQAVNPNLSWEDSLLAYALSSQQQKKQMTILEKLQQTPDSQQTISELKIEYPQYKDMSDDDIANQSLTANQRYLIKDRNEDNARAVAENNRKNVLAWAKMGIEEKRLVLQEDRLNFDHEKFNTNLDYQKAKLALMNDWQQQRNKIQMDIANMSQSGQNSRTAANIQAKKDVAKMQIDSKGKQTMRFKNEQYLRLGFPASVGLDIDGATSQIQKWIKEGLVRVDPVSGLYIPDQRNPKAQAQIDSEISSFMDVVETGYTRATQQVESGKQQAPPVVPKKPAPKTQQAPATTKKGNKLPAQYTSNARVSNGKTVTIRFRVKGSK